MSTTVDERIVSMEFDNRHFEKNVQTTMSTLDKFKKALNLDGASKGLQTASSDMQKSFEQSEYAAYRSGWRFSDIIHDTWLKAASVFEYQVANKIASGVRNMVNALTIEPIKTGLQEYETQLGAIQTILANTESKGSTLDDVNKALDELNAYSDKTIYNFTEMTKNIGTFTAAGVDLETSVSAIKGIANLAAVSGSTSQQASTAMYQLSQALSSGTVKLMDWNSVVNAGMGGQVFQDSLKETARIHGVAIDEMIKEQGSFRETLSEGWLTSEILLETLSKFTGDLNEKQLKSMGYTEEQIKEIIKLGQTATDAATKVKTFTQLMDTLKETAQSGWAQTWEIVIGDFGEAKELWTNVSNVLGGMLGKSAEARNELLSGALQSGWKQLLGTGIKDEANYGEYIKETAKEHGIAIDKMIEEEGSLEKALKKGFAEGTISADILTESLGKLSNLYSTRTDEQLKNLGYTKKEVEALRELNEQFQNGSISMDEFAKKIGRLSGRELIIESLGNVFKSLINIVTPIKEAFTEIFPPTTSEQLYKLIEGFRNATQAIREFTERNADKLKRTFKGIFAVIDIVVHIVKVFAGAIFDLLGCFDGFGDGILSATANIGDFLVSVRDAIKGSSSLVDFTNGIVNIFKTIINAFKNMASSFKVKFETSGLESLLDLFKAIWEAAKKVIGVVVGAIGGIGKALSNTISGSGIEVIMDIINAGLLTSLIMGIKKLVSGFQGITDIIDNIKDILDNVGDAFKAFQNKLKAEAIKTIAVSVAILAGSLLLLALIDKDKLEDALAAMTMLFAGLIGAMAAFGNLKTMTVGAGQMIGLSASLLLLAFALTKLASIDSKTMTKGIANMTIALTVLIGALAAMSTISSTKNMSTKGATQLLKITLVLYVLAGALKLLGSLSWEEIGKGLVAMTGGLTALVGALAVMSTISNTKNMSTKGAGQILKIALVMIPLALALKLIATMSWEDIAKGLTVMGAGLVALVGALAIMSKIDSVTNKMAKGKSKGSNAKVVIGKCAQLTLIAVALGVLALSLALVAQLSWKSILTGLGAMVLTLTVLITGLKVLSKVNESSIGKSSASLILISIAIKMLATTLAFLGNIKWDKLAKGVIAMGVTLLILVSALKSINGLLSNANTLSATAAALIVMAISLKLLTGVIREMGNMDLITIAKGVLGLAAVLGVFVAVTKLIGPVAVGTFVALAGGIALLGLACLAAGAGVALIAKGLSMIGEHVGAAIQSLCQAIIDSAGVLGKAAEVLIVSLLQALTNVTDELVTTLLKIILNTLDSLAQFAPQIADSLMSLLINVLDKIIDYIPDIVQLCVKVFTKIFEGVTDALSKIDPDVWLKGIIGVGIFAAILAALSAIAGMIPSAMLGVLGMGAVMAELALVLGAVGLLTKIPGLMEFIEKGGNLLEKIGTAIGQFIGGIAGGISKGFSSSLPALGTNLSVFMNNLKPFLDGIKSLDSGVLSNAKTLVEVLLTITAANLLESLTSWLTGGSSMANFAKELVLFGAGIASFASQVAGIKIDQVKAAAEAGKTLAEMAESIPSSGGLFQLFSGTHDLTSFGEGLGSFGKGLNSFATNVKNIDPVTVKAAAEAGKTLAEMTNYIPESGGLFSLFTGNSDMLSFAQELALFGAGIKCFNDAVTGINATSLTAAAEAGKTIAKMAHEIPTEGGLWGLLAGGNDRLANFGIQLGAFGKGISEFAKTIIGTDFSKVGEATDAGTKLAKMAHEIPTEGGLWGLLAGGNDRLTNFASGITLFGAGLAAFTNWIKSIDDGSYGKIDAATNAGIKLAKMAHEIPTEGGLWGLIAGGNDRLANFASGITTFGKSISEFAKATANSEFGNVDKAINTGNKIALMAKIIPTSGGLFDSSVENMDGFKTQIIAFGKGISEFAKATANSDFGKVDGAISAGTKLVTLAKIIPSSGGLFTPNSGVNNMTSFKTQIVTFGEGIAKFAEAISGHSFENAITAAKAGLTISKVANNISSTNTANVYVVSQMLPTLATKIKEFVTTLSDVSLDLVSQICSDINSMIQSLASVNAAGIASVISSFEQCKNTIVNTASQMMQMTIDTFNSYIPAFATAGKNMMNSFNISILTGSINPLVSISNMITSMINILTTSASSFATSGMQCVIGFANGITMNTFYATAAATAMAQAALDAANEVFVVESPSKAFYQTGEYCAQGLTNALDDAHQSAYNAGYDLATHVKNGLQKAINTSMILIENGVNLQPTIKPVLDLTDVEAGIGRLNGMLNFAPSSGVMMQVNSIGSSMNKIQNRSNDDVVSAIKDLGDSLNNTSGDTYNIGITNTADEEVRAAVNTLVRAAIVGRRI